MICKNCGHLIIDHQDGHCIVLIVPSICHALLDHFCECEGFEPSNNIGYYGSIFDGEVEP